ncbi:MAG: alkaline phosphatase family protein [Sedimentisphaerales bacterium]|nr:alkaline phosphatase family protein [Sedimentisphaerales bacterium]
MSKRVIFACLAVIIVGSGFGFAQQSRIPKNVILIGWDGAQREHVQQCLDRKELPNLQRLIDQGTMVEIDVEGKTDTKAGWSQILTGYYPTVTGVYSNANFQPVPKGYSVFERLEERFGKDHFVTVAVIGKKAHCGEIRPPEKITYAEWEKRNSKKKTVQPGTTKKPEGKVVTVDGVRYVDFPGSPYYNMYTALEVWEYGLMKDEAVGKRALELLETYKNKPFFFFVHFAEVDHSGHQKGENSREYNDALISNDLWTGRIMDKLKELNLADKTTIYVTADHGFNEDMKGHSFAPYVFLATNDKKVTRSGRRQDVAPTIYEAFGVDVSKMIPPLDGISLTKADNRPAAKIAPVTAPKQKKTKQTAAQKAAQKARQTQQEFREPDVIFVPTPQEVVDKMLELAQVKQSDIVYDLGCGDGRIVVTAAKEFGCRAFGFDIDPQRIKESNENVEKNQVGHLVTIEQQDIFTLDLSDVDVVTLYLLPSLNVKLIPQLQKLKPGSRIVSHDFPMKGVTPDQVVHVVTSDDQTEHTVYLWTTPLKMENKNN